MVPATAERSFSALRRLKQCLYLGATTRQSRLHSFRPAFDFFCRKPGRVPVYINLDTQQVRWFVRVARARQMEWNV